MENIINIEKYSKSVIEVLLHDKTTNENIIFANNSYCEYGLEYFPKKQININIIKGAPAILQPRLYKSKSKQIERTRTKAEVYTPTWLCNKMINYLDNDWFQSENIFNIELEKDWITNLEPIKFNNKKWTNYIDSTRLEMTCGEGSFLVSRYDTTTGNLIDVNNRIGILDRKLRVVNKNTTSEKDWFKWTYRAYQSVYGYELQGDNLLIARINLLQTFIDNLQFKWNREPTVKELEELAEIISWNIWQMDGLRDCIPHTHILCKIMDWKSNEIILFKHLKKNEFL